MCIPLAHQSKSKGCEYQEGDSSLTKFKHFRSMLKVVVSVGSQIFQLNILLLLLLREDESAFKNLTRDKHVSGWLWYQIMVKYLSPTSYIVVFLCPLIYH